MTQNLNKSILKRYYKALNTAIIEGNLECFKTDLVIALKAGYPINFSPARGGYKGMTLLHSALCTGLHHTSCGPTFAEILLDNGADVNIKDSWGYNALYYASFYLPSPHIYERIVSQTEDIRINFNWWSISDWQLDNSWQYTGNMYSALEILFIKFIYSISDNTKNHVKVLLKTLLSHGLTHEDVVNACNNLPDSPQDSGDIVNSRQEILAFSDMFLQSKSQLKKKHITSSFDYGL